MQIHEIRPKNKPKKKKRIGRGGKHGFTSGRGQKGQRARAGHRFQPAVRYIFKRYPKLKGYRFKGSRSVIVILNVDDLAKNFEAGAVINPRILMDKKLVNAVKGRTPIVKILGNGELAKSFTLEKCLVSKLAKEKIIKAGGKVNGLVQ